VKRWSEVGARRPVQRADKERQRILNWSTCCQASLFAEATPDHIQGEAAPGETVRHSCTRNRAAGLAPGWATQVDVTTAGQGTSGCAHHVPIRAWL